jgi:hypothetical protein
MDDPQKQRLDSSCANASLDWQPRWKVRMGLEEVVRYYVRMFRVFRPHIRPSLNISISIRGGGRCILYLIDSGPIYTTNALPFNHCPSSLVIS